MYYNTFLAGFLKIRTDKEKKVYQRLLNCLDICGILNYDNWPHLNQVAVFLTSITKENLQAMPAYKEHGSFNQRMDLFAQNAYVECISSEKKNKSSE